MHLLLHLTYLSPVDSWTTGGSIQYAECSESSDAEKILSEIGPDCAVVDFAIQVLLTAGMSTTALRDIARAGVDIHNACSIFRDHCSSDHPGSLRLADLLTFDFRTLLWKWWVDCECPPVSIYFLPNHHHDSPVPQRNRRHILRFKGPDQSSRVASDAAVAGMFHCHLHEALTTVGLVNSIGSGPGLCGDSLHPWHQKHGPDAFWAADLTGFLRARHYRLFSL